MSLGACLPALEADGKVPADQAAEARALYDERLAHYAATGSREAAEALASADVLAALERQVTRKAFVAGRTIKVRQRIAGDIGGYGGGGGGSAGPGGAGPLDPRAGPALIDHDPRAPFSNVEGRRKAILGSAHREIDRLLAEHSANLLGQVRHKAQLGDIVRELFGENTGNHAARELAEAWRRSAEGLRRRFNAAGGEIGFRADWGLPQSHDWRKVRAAGFEAWRAFIADRLDHGKMIDQRTGQAFTREGLEAVLPEVYDTIRSNGWSKRTPGSPAGKGAAANRRADPRFFVFKSAAAWSEYAERFGSGTAYDAMMGHVEGMARDTAAMEILGPNPAATIEWVKGTLEQSAALDRSPGSAGVGAARSGNKRMAELWDEYRGAHNEPRNEKLALMFSGYRALATSRRLGSAFLSAASDLGFTQSRRAFNGLGGPGTMLADYLKLMRPGSLEDQKLAVRRGLIAEEWSHRTATQSRFLMEELTGEIPRRLAEGVLRASLLVRHTQSLRWANGMEWLATFTEHAGQAHGELHPKLRGALERYGIDPAGWDALRHAPMDTDRGAEWISPHNLEDRELASRFMEMIHEETDLAVPMPDLGTRSLYNRALERGTWIGELGRSGPLLFRSFGISVLLNQVREISAMSGAQAARYAGGLIIGTTLMGALALQLKAVSGGQDPRPMEDKDFWGAAMAQGGGWGIFGDFLYSSESRAQHGLASTIAGPAAQDVQDLVDLGTAKHPQGKIVRVAKGWLPGNNLWYTRLAFDRMMADQIQQAVDPTYAASQARVLRAAHEQGTAYWWRPGHGAPDRAPDFANTLEEGPAR